MDWVRIVAGQKRAVVLPRKRNNTARIVAQQNFTRQGLFYSVLEDRLTPAFCPTMPHN
jgi:predicted glycosyltransferase